MKIINFTIKSGNLVLEQNADIIINASNTMLVLGSGVSMAFKRHCGQKLQIEMTALLSKFHKAGYKLKKGDVVPTSSGDASNFKQTLHVAMVDYNPGVHFSGKQPDLSTIDLALKNIKESVIEYAHSHNKNNVSLAIPLLGCGVGGLDKIEVVEKYRAFFSKRKETGSELVCHVIIYAFSQTDFDLLNEVFTV